MLCDYCLYARVVSSMEKRTNLIWFGNTLHTNRKC